LRLLALSYARLVASPKWSRELQLPMTKGGNACGKSLDRAKERLRCITRRNPRGIAFERMIAEVNGFTTGWVTYFRHAGLQERTAGHPRMASSETPLRAARRDDVDAFGRSWYRGISGRYHRSVPRRRRARC
jgi:hypothetical protein